MSQKACTELFEGIVPDLKRLDESTLCSIREYVDKKLREARGNPWDRHFAASAWTTPLRFDDIAEKCGCDVSVPRRVFLAGLAPGNWIFKYYTRGPEWPSTMLDRWKEVLANVDMDSLPEDGPVVHQKGSAGTFGPKEV